MGIIKNWQAQVKEHFFMKMVRQLDIRRVPLPFSVSKTVGILVDATDPDRRPLVQNFADKLKKQGKEVRLLGFFDSKQPVDNFTFKAFNRSEVDWLERPKGTVVDDFIRQKFDILISIHQDQKLPLEYIAASSHAQLRVGPYTDHTFCYDLMIEQNQELDLSKYLKEVIFFLNRMNSNRHEATTI